MARNKVRATAGRKAEAISAELCGALLALTTRRLVDDIRTRYRVKRSTAFHAVAIARARGG